MRTNSAMAPNPENNAATLPTATALNNAGGAEERSGSISTAAPAMAIVPSKNENSAATAGTIPNARAIATVEPLREIPGKMARACAQPIQKATDQGMLVW